MDKLEYIINRGSNKKRIVRQINKNEPIFKSRRIKNLTHSLNIFGINFISSSISIIDLQGDNNETEYLLNFRMLNYKIINNIYCTNTKINNNDIYISLNKMLKLNNMFDIIDDNKLIVPPLLQEISKSINKYNKNILGIEDMRIFKFKDKIKIIGTAQDINNKTNIISGNYDYSTNTLFDINFLENTFNNQKIEKNWIYFINNNEELNIIYKWYPLQICNICNNKLCLIKNINMPDYFKNARGSSCCVKYNNQNWFIVHFNEEGNYYHFFVLFDIDMNLIKYSSKFKFEGYKIEFCIGFTVKNNDFLICYSLNDSISKIALYDINRLNELIWY